MSDPIDRLSRFGDAFESDLMPRAASEIRARGDRIRRRKHALVAGVSAAAVAAVAVPVIALTAGNGSDDEPDLAPQPTISDPVDAAPLSAENLLTTDDAIYPNGAGDLVEGSTFDLGDGPFGQCSEATLEELGATTAPARQFEFEVGSTGLVDQGVSFTEVVAEFPSDGDAAAAYDEIKGWYDECAAMDDFHAGEFSPVPNGFDATAEAQVSSFGAGPDTGWFVDTGLVLRGDRIAVLSLLVEGQDYSWDGPTPVEQMLPVAVERLVLGNGHPADGPVTGELPTTIPPDFPLDAGFPAHDGSGDYQLAAPSIDNQAMVPGGDLDGCGQPVEAVGVADRLTTRLDTGSTSYSRELQLFADTTEAVRYFDSIQDAYAVCANEDDAYATELHGDNLAVLWNEGADRSVTIAVRKENAVLVAIESDDQATDAATVERMWTAVGEGLGGVYEALDELLRFGGGTPPATDPGLGEPAGTTAIPDDIPLAVDMSDMSGDGGEYRTPYHPDGSEEGLTLAPCGQAVWPAAGTVDQLWAWATGPEYGARRELVTFGTVDEAVAALEAFETALAACSSDGTEVWTRHEADTGYVSVTFSRTYDGLGLDLFQATRVGNAVLLTQVYGEGTLASVEGALPDRTRLTQQIAPTLCVFTEAGC